MKLPGASTGVVYAVGDAAALTIGFDRGVLYAEVPAGTARTTAGPELTPDAWHHVTVTAGAGPFGDRLVVWVDGATYGEVGARLPAIAGEAVLGGIAGASMPATVPGAHFVGAIDELQIARVQRPAGVLQAASRGQGLEQRLVAFEPAETSSSFGSGYLTILLRSVTIDGWVVIAILGVMAVVSWMVMVGKTIYIGRVARANDIFRAEFQRTGLPQTGSVGAAAVGLSDERMPILRQSPLYCVYALAAREVAQRGGDPGQGIGEESGGVKAGRGLATERQKILIRLTHSAQWRSAPSPRP